MQQLASAAPQSKGRDFADLFAGLALPAKKPPARDLDGLEDDVATLTYEQALRNHPVPSSHPAEVSAPVPVSRTAAQETPATCPQTHARRSSSVTVRFSSSEAGQLHLRAAEAGLTVSAYLRSCAFEVESLRAQVKSALAQFRSAAPQPEAKPDTKPVESSRRWIRSWSRLFRSGGQS